MKSVTENVVSDVLGQDHLCMPSSNMLRMTYHYHIIIKTLVKFELIGLCDDVIVCKEIILICVCGNNLTVPFSVCCGSNAATS